MDILLLLSLICFVLDALSVNTPPIKLFSLGVAFFVASAIW